MLLLWVWAVFDVISSDAELVRNLPKMIWLVLVIFIPTLGSIAWLIMGRPAYASFAPGGARARGGPSSGSTRMGPYGPETAPRSRVEPEITDRRSAELDARLDAWEQSQTPPDELDRRAAELDAREAELEARQRDLDARDDPA